MVFDGFFGKPYVVIIWTFSTAGIFEEWVQNFTWET